MTKIQHQIKADARTLLGRKVKQLRKEGLLPATVYGKGLEPLSIQMGLKEASAVFEEVGESGLVEIKLGEDNYPVLFRNPQYHPINGAMLHIDCYKVNLREKIIATVPVELIGESAAVKAGNVLVAITSEVEVEALPANLPEKIEVDISVLESVDSMITVADLKVDDKVTIKTDAEQVIAKVEEPKEEEVVTEEVAPSEVPATQQKTEEEKAAAEAAKKED